MISDMYILKILASLLKQKLLNWEMRVFAYPSINIIFTCSFPLGIWMLVSEYLGNPWHFPDGKIHENARLSRGYHGQTHVLLCLHYSLTSFVHVWNLILALGNVLYSVLCSLTDPSTCIVNGLPILLQGIWISWKDRKGVRADRFIAVPH